MPNIPWPSFPVTHAQFLNPPREYGILPFWFLNGELDPQEMRFQLEELNEKRMSGVILHGRYGLEMPYLSQAYLDRIRFATEEAEKIGVKAWIYDEMNWPSGTADKRVLQSRPDLAQRYIECLNFTVRGPWFNYLTGADSRYLDFERSKPVAAFAIQLDESGAYGKVIDLTPNLSFRNVIPWEAPAGNWRLMYIVEKEADYYIDALNPEATAEFLRLGYEPYARLFGEKMSSRVPGFYTDEPAMHYYLSGQDSPIVPWTRDMFRRFQERNGYKLRPRLPDLFFDIRPDSARVRYDFYNTLTEFYSQAYYQQIHTWCQEHDVLFTGHLLYEESLRRLIRVEGNLFKHYAHMDVIGVDHLYPIIGSRDRPDEHVAMKVGSSAAHHFGSPRLLCESFGGIFMDATMQRMKWLADWEYVLGVNFLNPHGFHYTLEGPRKRDWPPSQFYQYPWWPYYGEFSNYISRLSHMLSGGRHIAKVAVLWPINAAFAAYTPQSHNTLGDRTEEDFNVLTDLLLRLHYDFDYIDEDILAGSQVKDGTIQVRDEAYELLILPPMTCIKLSTLEQLERFVQVGGRLLGLIFLPGQAFGPGQKDGSGMLDISERVHALFGVHPVHSQQSFQSYLGVDAFEKEHPMGGKASFLRSYALARRLPLRLQKQPGIPGSTDGRFSIESENGIDRYFFTDPGGEKQDITAEVHAERASVSQTVRQVLNRLVLPDILIDNEEVFYLHRVKDRRDIYFLVNPTFETQPARITLAGISLPLLWNPSTGSQRMISPAKVTEGYTQFALTLPPAGSAFILTEPSSPSQIAESSLEVAPSAEAHLAPLILDGEWEFEAESANALVIGHWLALAEDSLEDQSVYFSPTGETPQWQPMLPGAWTYQLPSEPNSPFPTPVWYRISFQMDFLPPRLDLIVDGFAGSAWELHVNGRQVNAAPIRSLIDSQMKSVEITSFVQPGMNLIALRLVLTGPTDGLLDPLKLMGNFSLTPLDDGLYKISPPRDKIQPDSWTAQGYPFYSGRAVYRRRFELSPGNDPAPHQRIFLEPVLCDDVLEVLINHQPVGVRLWPPYTIEVTDFIHPGENLLELRLANTLVNLLEAVERPSGLTGAPRLVSYPGSEADQGVWL